MFFFEFTEEERAQLKADIAVKKEVDSETCGDQKQRWQAIL